MSMWGMNDGAALSGAAKFTNGAATFIDGGNSSHTTFVTDALVESEEEIMNYYDLTDIAKRDLN